MDRDDIYTKIINVLATIITVAIMLSIFIYLWKSFWYECTHFYERQQKLELEESCRNLTWGRDDIKGYWENHYQYRRCLYNENHK